MKKLSFLPILFVISSLCNAQDTTGLIAHWNMNGTSNDVSGHGHNGTQSNLTPAVGKDGLMGHAYYFNGTNSVITVPYSPAFNIPNVFTFCTTVMVEGFYTGTCQMNMLFTRGGTSGGSSMGNYYMFFNDKANTADDCSTIDSTQETFHASCAGIVPINEAAYGYTPAIVKNQWYSLVIVFNDTSYKTYVNGVLMNTAIVTTPGMSVGTSTDSVSIGYNVFEAASGFPYAFNGRIDDIQFFNRVLTTAEIDSYTTSTLAVNNITLNQNEIAIYPNPATNELNIATTALLHGAMTITIADVMGREFIKTQCTNETTRIDVSTLNPGVYFACIYCDNQVVTRRFVKQ